MKTFYTSLMVSLFFFVWHALSAQTSALQFNGTNNYVDLPSTLYNNNLSGGTAITIEYWFKGINVQSAVRFQYESNHYVIAGWGTKYGVEPKFQVSTDNGIEGVPINGEGDNVQDGNWHHVACVWEKNTVNGFRTYLDGELSNQINSADVNLPAMPNGFNSRLSVPSGECTDGILDEVRIWNVARTEEQIQEYMCQTLSGSETGLVAYYRMSDGSGATLTDNSVHTYNGTLVNSPAWVNDYHIPQGDGSESTPYLIAGINHLCWLSQTPLVWDDDAYFEQTINLNMLPTQNWDDDHDGTKEGFSPIGNRSTKFNGNYNGGAFSINNLFINRPSTDYIGFFGYTDGSVVEKVSLTNAVISGNINVGVLVGKNQTSTISYCWSAGSVIANQGGGGLVGGNVGTSVINNSYSHAGVTITDTDGGGFVGANFSTVTNCYCTGPVSAGSGANFVGGFIGYVDDSSLENCFWDTQTTTQTTGIGYGNATGVSGKTTAEMKKRSTFTGWDFATIWGIASNVNNGYPNLENDNSGSTFTWDGSESNNWETAGNWDINAVPSSGDAVVVANIGTQPVLDAGQGVECMDLTVNSGATLTINPQGSLITYGSITNNGTISVEQTLADDGHWHLIAMPNATTTANTFLDMYLQQWNEPAASWADIVDPATPLTPVKGYSLWMPTTKGSFTYTGTPNTGNQSLAITHSGSGWNLMGNPYPSFLDWDAVDGYGTKYTWNGTAYDQRSEAGAGDGSQYVAPTEGFFIYTAANATFSLTNAMRAHVPLAKSAEAATLQNGLVLTASNGNYHDNLWIVLDDRASPDFELERDAWKLLSPSEGLSQLYSHSPDGILSIDVRPYQESIPLGFANDQAGFYSIGVEQIAEVSTAILEDTKSNVFHDLTKGAYSFAWEPADDEGRFVLHLGVTGMEQIVQPENMLMYAAGQTIYLKSLDGPVSGTFILNDLAGRRIYQQKMTLTGTATLEVRQPSGVYIALFYTHESCDVNKIFLK